MMFLIRKVSLRTQCFPFKNEKKKKDLSDTLFLLWNPQRCIRANNHSGGPLYLSLPDISDCVQCAATFHSSFFTYHGRRCKLH